MPRSSLVGFTFLCLTYLALSYILVNMTDVYHSLDKENGLYELLGAFSLLGTSVLLFMAAVKRQAATSRKNLRFILLTVAGVLFFWAWGEELSWGQHMLGTVTPDWLAEVNDQNETNLHNINKKFFDRWLDRCITLLAIITAIYHLAKKERIFTVKIPDYFLGLAFILVPIYRRHETFTDNDIWPISFLFFPVYIYLAYRERSKPLAIMCLLFLITTVVVIYTNHFKIEFLRGNTNIHHEIKEMMFSVVCIFYAYRLYMDEKNLTS